MDFIRSLLGWRGVLWTSRCKWSSVMQVGDYLEDGQLKVMRNTKTSEEVLVKFVGTVPKEGIPKGLEREIINHRRLLHPNIVQFYEVCPTFQYTSLTQPQPSHGLVSRLRWCACIGCERHWSVPVSVHLISPKFAFTQLRCHARLNWIDVLGWAMTL